MHSFRNFFFFEDSRLFIPRVYMGWKKKTKKKGVKNQSFSLSQKNKKKTKKIEEKIEESLEKTLFLSWHNVLLNWG